MQIKILDLSLLLLICVCLLLLLLLSQFALYICVDVANIMTHLLNLLYTYKRLLIYVSSSKSNKMFLPVFSFEEEH